MKAKIDGPEGRSVCQNIHAPKPIENRNRKLVKTTDVQEKKSLLDSIRHAEHRQMILAERVKEENRVVCDMKENLNSRIKKAISPLEAICSWNGALISRYSIIDVGGIWSSTIIAATDYDYEDDSMFRESLRAKEEVEEISEDFLQDTLTDNPSVLKADVLLVTVTRIETLAVIQMAKELINQEVRRFFRDNLTFYYLGVLGGVSTWLVRSEMGSGGASGSIITINDAIQELEPGAIVMVGIAFGVDPYKQPIGQILVSRQILDYELQRIGSTEDGKVQLIPRGDRPQASPRLLNRFRDGDLEWSGAKVDFGLVLSGSKLIDNNNYRDLVLALEPEAIGGEMEGAGLYAAAAAKKVDWILVKAICDYADGHKRENKEENQQTAAKNAAHFALYVIACGGFVEH